LKWQDGVFTLGGLLFAIALLPTILNPSAFIPRVTSILTAAVLTVYGLTFLTLKLKLSTISTLLTGVMWWIIVIWRG